MSEQSLTGQLTAPPRLAGTADQKIAALGNWLWDVFTKLQLTELYVQFADQFGATSFDPSSLTDPADATIATAQQTANEAYTIAASNANTLGFTGEFTISDTATSAVVTFDDAETSTDYTVFIQSKDFTGAPSSNALLVTKITKTTADFTADIVAAPGAGTSVTYDYLVRR